MVAIPISSVLAYLTALVTPGVVQDPLVPPTNITNGLPDFVLKYAPLSHLHSSEQYWPSDVQFHLTKVVPEVDFKPVGGSPTLQTLSLLANNVALSAVASEDVLAHKTPFFTSVSGKPDASGASAAPGTIIAVQKPGGIVDAFYFYFYSWNEGNT